MLTYEDVPGVQLHQPEEGGDEGGLARPCTPHNAHLLAAPVPERMRSFLTDVTRERGGGGWNWKAICGILLRSLPCKNFPILFVPKTSKPNSWTYNFVAVSGQNESSQTWGSVYNVYITNKFYTTFAQGGGVKSVSRGDC